MFKIYTLIASFLMLTACNIKGPPAPKLQDKYIIGASFEDITKTLGNYDTVGYSRSENKYALVYGNLLVVLSHEGYAERYQVGWGDFFDVYPEAR